MKRLVYILFFITAFCQGQIINSYAYTTYGGGSRVYTAGNLIQSPEDLSNAVWTKGYLDVDATGITDPFGGSTSIRYDNWSATRTTIRQIISPVTVGVEYTLTFYAKKGTTTDMRWAVLDSSSGVITSASYLGQTTQDAWELVTVSFTPTDSFIYLFLAYDNLSTGTFEVWGANLDLTTNY